jgi:hypothetical protein
MKNNLPTILYFCFAIGIACACYFGFYQSKSIDTDTLISEVKQTNFSKDDANVVIADTFMMLVNKAYNGLATVVKNGDAVLVSMTDANKVTKDFFNGNDALLKCNIKEHGFEIKYIAEKNKLDAQFSLMQNTVTVPNDVLIKIVDKLDNKIKNTAQ